MTRIIQNCISWIKIIHLWWLQMVNNHPFLDVPWFNWWCWWCCACPTLQMLEQRGGFAIRIFLEGLVLSWDCSNWSSWRVHDRCYGQFVFHDKHFNCRELSDLNSIFWIRNESFSGDDWWPWGECFIIILLLSYKRWYKRMLWYMGQK